MAENDIQATERREDDPQVGGITEGPGEHGATPEGARFDADAGGKAHTRLDEGHPAGDGERTDRQVGGPTSADGAEPSSGTEPGAHGDIPTKGFEPHE